MRALFVSSFVFCAACSGGDPGVRPGAYEPDADENFVLSPTPAGLTDAFPPGLEPPSPDEWADEPIQPGEYLMTVEQIVRPCDDYLEVGGQYVERVFWDPEVRQSIIFGIAPIFYVPDGFVAIGEGRRVVGDACEVTDLFTFHGMVDAEADTFFATVVEERETAGQCSDDDLTMLCDNEYIASFVYMPPPGDAGNPAQ